MSKLSAKRLAVKAAAKRSKAPVKKQRAAPTRRVPTIYELGGGRVEKPAKAANSDLVFILTGVDCENINYLGYGPGGVARVYQRDQYDSRLSGFGALPYFDDEQKLVAHVLAGGLVNCPAQVNIKLMPAMGWTPQQMKRVMAAAA